MRNQVLWSILILFAAGCNSDSAKDDEPSQKSKYSVFATAENGARVIAETSAADDVVTLPAEDSPAPKTVFPLDKGSESVKEPVTADPDALYKKLFPHADDKSTIKVSINYDSANLGDVIPSFAIPLKLNYLLDPGVTGTVTMALQAEMTQREVWTLFEQILQLAGAYCEMENQVIHIRPISKIPQEKKMFRSDSNVEVRLIQLKYVSAKEIVNQLKSFLSDGAIATPLEKQNAVMLVENHANMERLLMLVEQLDRRMKSGWHRAVFVCHNVSASQLQHELLELLPILGFPVSDGKKTDDSGGIGIVCLERIQAIVISAATEAPLHEIRRWIDILDKADIAEQEKVFLYDVMNGKADELVSALSVVFPVESTVMSATSANNATSSSTKTDGKTTVSAAKTAASPQNSKPKTATERNKSNSIYDTPVKIFADAVHNRLLIRTTPRTYAMLRAILERLDTVPAQILMQILVVEIELSDDNEFGVEFSGAGTAGNTKSLWGTNFEALSPDPSGATRQTGGTFTIFNPDNPDQKFGYVRALASKNNLKVLSSPQILAKSHSQAKISVGKRVPVISNEITDTESTSVYNTSLRRTYQYENTGVILTVTPQVTKGGMISMVLEQTISDAVDNTTRGIDSPIIKEDTLSTELALRDGRTIIMGGLIKEKHNEVVSSLPLIVEIPFLRALFGDTNKESERTEILVLVTATIIQENSNLEEMVHRYQQAVLEIKKFEKRMYGPRKGKNK